ncbi:hypothetical protein SORBI_3007G182400 [Sorghum bicolor]|uniref:Uncharacterized protein n=1 Tax=Sorghum bicolor TaxID=4558 RepID=A0A1B6PIE8_SORBI|nr:hypothetical protein SORBI_3007G182400 [Sorghum bicolor]
MARILTMAILVSTHQANCGCLYYLSLANKWCVWLSGLFCIESSLLGASNFAPFETFSQTGDGHLGEHDKHLLLLGSLPWQQQGILRRSTWQ